MDNNKHRNPQAGAAEGVGQVNAEVLPVVPPEQLPPPPGRYAVPQGSARSSVLLPDSRFILHRQATHGITCAEVSSL